MTRNKKFVGNVIPSPRAAGALSVTDGGDTIGSIVIRGESFFSFDADGVLLGEFDTQRDAVFAFPIPESKPLRERRRSRSEMSSRR